MTSNAESRGGQARVKAARFPAVKTLDDFDFAFQRSLKREALTFPTSVDSRVLVPSFD